MFSEKRPDPFYSLTPFILSLAAETIMVVRLERVTLWGGTIRKAVEMESCAFSILILGKPKFLVCTIAVIGK